MPDGVGRGPGSPLFGVLGHGAAGQPDVTIFTVKGIVAAVTSTRRLRIRWLEDVRRSAGGLESLPDFICLPRDESGLPIIPL
jgi:hypothetical protein